MVFLHHHGGKFQDLCRNHDLCQRRQHRHRFGGYCQRRHDRFGTRQQDGTFGATSSSIAGTVLAAPGTYYLRVTNFSTTTPITPYDLYFAVRSGAPTAETEPNNNGTPQALPASQCVSGVIDPAAPEDSDTFTFTANAGDTVFISLDLDPERDVTTYNGRIGIGLFGTPAQFLVTSDGGTGDTIDSEAIFMTVDTTGTYQVYTDCQVAGGGSPTATYNFNVTTFRLRLRERARLTPMPRQRRLPIWR